MLDDIAGTYGSRLFAAAGGVAVALLVLVGVLWLVRNRAPSPFVRGGKGRQQRLQVLDAAAIDARRRIVLIRRDGVEHLVMIGGPTDIVIESGIGDPTKVPMLQTVIAAPAPAETLIGDEQPRPARQLDTPRDPPRVASRPSEPAAQLSPPPAQAAIEAPVPERRLRPEPAAPAPVSPPTVVTPPTVVAAPAAVVPPTVLAPPVVVAPTERPQPPAPAIPPVAAPVVPPVAAPSEPVVFERSEEVADILEAARSRVLAPQPERQPDVVAAPSPAARSPAAAPILAQDAYRETFDVAAPEVAAPRKLGSDFEKILEVEMSSTLTAERAAAPPPAPSRPAADSSAPPPRRDPDLAPIAGGDAALQKEVARIFGEISVDRDK